MWGSLANFGIIKFSCNGPDFNFKAIDNKIVCDNIWNNSSNIIYSEF